jgi:hypothetical protein
VSGDPVYFKFDDQARRVWFSGNEANTVEITSFKLEKLPFGRLPCG